MLEGTGPLCPAGWLASCSQGHPCLTQFFLTLDLGWSTKAAWTSSLQVITGPDHGDLEEAGS